MGFGLLRLDWHRFAWLSARADRRVRNGAQEPEGEKRNLHAGLQWQSPPVALITLPTNNRSGDDSVAVGSLGWNARAADRVAPLPRRLGRRTKGISGQRLLPRTRQDAVDAFPRLLHGLFLARGQASQRGPRQDGKIGARGVDADAPLRPLTPRDDVIAAIAASLCGRHLRGSFPPPVSNYNAATAGWFQHNQARHRRGRSRKAANLLERRWRAVTHIALVLACRRGRGEEHSASDQREKRARAKRGLERSRFIEASLIGCR